jgi:hypothetical protein
VIRCTIELLPGGDASRARTIGMLEIARVGLTDAVGDYAVVLTKTPPFTGALKAAWRRGRVSVDGDLVTGIATGEDDEVIAGFVAGHHRTKRGVYDLMYRALKACGMEARCPPAAGAEAAR